jgi:hypothetical protein
MSTTPPPVPAETPQPEISPLGRIFGVLFSPGATFADIARAPRWIAPILVLTVLSLCVSFALMRRVDWPTFLEKKMSQSSRWEQLSDAQKKQQLEMAEKIVPYQSYAIGLLAPVVAALIIGGVYCGAFNLFLSARVKFKTAFAITAHALMIGIVSSPLILIVSLLKRPGEVDPEHLLASNIGEFLSSDTPKWLLKIADSLDIFSFWLMALLAIGFAAANPKKISKGGAFGVVLGVWAVWVLVKVCWAAIFG